MVIASNNKNEVLDVKLSSKEFSSISSPSILAILSETTSVNFLIGISNEKLIIIEILQI